MSAARRLLPHEVAEIVDRARAKALEDLQRRQAAQRCEALNGPCCCGQHAHAPAEAATDLGAEPTGRRRRLGPIGPVHRVLLQRRPTYTVAAVMALSIACAVRWVFA